ncbi:MAG: T9SS type A sorting domain-containing protein, partial [Ginsengibacter sp.]
AINYTKLFYRLQIQHEDGSFTYSDILIITSDKTKNGYILFPNPARGHVQVYLNEFTQPVILILYDNTGKKIKEQSISQQSTSVELPASKGVYIIQLSDTNGSNKIRKKLVVQ